ncbi:DNA-directed RNA polymerase II core subunit rpb9 [Lobulomyces angularis]|nr:DNA-directed RNA polymerase II core subunit rpb9 [Lobulomyces angularis]
MQFCSGCDNLLYPRENKNERTLLMACRNCDNQEEAISMRVFKHDVFTAQEDHTSRNVILSDDPTYPRIEKECPACGYHEAVYFQSRAKSADTTMKVIIG